MTRNPRRRSGFTLIELLVVISLIILLASLTVGAVFRLMDAQRESNTNKHLLKIDMAYTQQRTAAVDQIKKGNYPDVLRLGTQNADGSQNRDRALALHMKLRLRKEFPQNFAEARFNAFPDANLSAAYGPKSSYTAAIGALNGTPDEESAVLLYIILSQGRGGATTDGESIAKTTLIFVGNSGQQRRVFVDEYGTPIGHRRWLTDNEMALTNDETNNSPFANGQSAFDLRDPDDPTGRLHQSNWPVANANIARTWFTQPLLNTVNDPFDGRNRGPTIVSAGKNKLFMATSGGLDDDLFSFRIQQSGKGN